MAIHKRNRVHIITSEMTITNSHLEHLEHLELQFNRMNKLQALLLWTMIAPSNSKARLDELPMHIAITIARP
jgi:hypothetical protein